MTECSDQSKPWFFKLRNSILATFGIDPSRLESQDLRKFISQSLDRIGNEELCEALRRLIPLPCALALDTHRDPPEDGDSPESFACDECDHQPSQQAHTNREIGLSDPTDSWKIIVSIVSALISDPRFQRSGAPRILITIAISRVANHIRDSHTLDLALGPLGPWCLKSLHSSLRELRIAASNAITSFISSRAPLQIVSNNRIFFLNFLRNLSQRGNLVETEAVILAWGKVARVCDEEELNIAILQLVKFLGHPNLLVSGLAFCELQSLSEFFRCSPEAMLRSFWRSIAISVVRDIISRPQKAQYIADLIGRSLNQFLLLAQTECIPFLVLMKKTGELERIASARYPGCTVKQLCMSPAQNLAGVLALLLSQDFQPLEPAVQLFLVDVDPGFHQDSLVDLLKKEPIATACALLKIAGEGDQGVRARAIHAISLLGSYTMDKKIASFGSPRSMKLAQAFIENHILGIMTYFADVLDSPQSVQPVTEKTRYLLALQQMLLLLEGRIGAATPQIRACLQSALRVPKLLDLTFQTWMIFIETADEIDIDALIDHTFAVIVQHWNTLSEKSQKRAYDIVEFLFEKHSQIVGNKALLLPSLAFIPLFSKFSTQIQNFTSGADVKQRIEAFISRCRDENGAVVEQGLREFRSFLDHEQSWIHQSVVGQQSVYTISNLTRVTLDASVKFTDTTSDIKLLSIECLGLLGCIDPNRIDTFREKTDVVVVSNFAQPSESIDFVALMLETVLVKAFRSASNPRAQNYLAFVMQELLKLCSFKSALVHPLRGTQNSGSIAQKWLRIPEPIRTTLIPYFNSKFLLKNPTAMPEKETYPIFHRDIIHRQWLETFTKDLLHRARDHPPGVLFDLFSRIVRDQDLSIAAFILPYAVLNICVEGQESDRADIVTEILSALETDVGSLTSTQFESVRLSSENIFQVIDYLSRWIKSKKKFLSEINTSRGRNSTAENEEKIGQTQISTVEDVLSCIRPQSISTRAMHCGSYARALFHWEQCRNTEKIRTSQIEQDAMYEQLQKIYAEIGEPDCIEGISVHLYPLDPEQQLLEHRKAGRWAAVQSWYELAVEENPEDVNLKLELLNCFREAGRYETLIVHADAMIESKHCQSSAVLNYAVEAAWVTSNWSFMDRILKFDRGGTEGMNFNIGIARAFMAQKERKYDVFKQIIAKLRDGVSKDFTLSNTMSLQTCHEQLLKLHALYEIELIANYPENSHVDRFKVLDVLEGRLGVLGAYTSDKQYILGIRRAGMELSNFRFSKAELASSWLTSGRLSRKINMVNNAYSSLIRASKLNYESTILEDTRLLWSCGHHRRAVQKLEKAIEKNLLTSQCYEGLTGQNPQQKQSHIDGINNLQFAKASLILAKWMDKSNCARSDIVIQKYQAANKSYKRWEKGHYHFGRYYNKQLESEKGLPESKKSKAFLAGEHAKLVIENYVRCVMYGAKHIYETVPKIITLWLNMATEVEVAQDQRQARPDLELKKETFEKINKLMRRYTEKYTAFPYYTALEQIISRMGHRNTAVSDILSTIIAKVVSSYPQQALWSLLSVAKSTTLSKAKQARNIIEMLKNKKRKDPGSDQSVASLINSAKQLSEALSRACDAVVDQRSATASLSKDLLFSHSLAPCRLVVPVEAGLTPALPTTEGSLAMKTHEPFPKNVVTIASFDDHVLVLSSMQRPRRITVRGSNGKTYGLLCKPKDDLRKDQRLMEFNAMVNRTLKKDIEASKRRLYIKTYAVTPLNEECGAIEWVDGLKTMRDILLRLYKQKRIRIDYGMVKDLLEKAIEPAGDIGIFQNQILGMFPSVLFEWFIENFPEPETWFLARLRYTRSCAVMSMAGHVLGLGDRHGENVLLEEGSGGVFHVDFNCLFDKGLTFEKPEVVPFRLTHNMVGAFGPYGVEGPFRIAAETTMQLLRANEDSLMTILETFLHDPTADFLGKKKRRIPGVPNNPDEVLENVRMKLQGLFRGESVSLGVQGYVDALIGMARDPRNLAAMYIGWCSFL